MRATTSVRSSSWWRREKKPKDPAVYMNEAGFYQRQGNFEKMIEAVQERTKQEPTNPEAFYTLATFYWEKASRDVKLSDAQKATYANAGLDAVNKALDLKSDYFEALTYKNLLLRAFVIAGVLVDPRQHEVVRDVLRVHLDHAQQQRLGL